MKAVQELFSWLGRHPTVPHLAASEETIFTNLVIMEEKGRRGMVTCSKQVKQIYVS
jgi:hypothetical protein